MYYCLRCFHAIHHILCPHWNCHLPLAESSELGLYFPASHIPVLIVHLPLLCLDLRYFLVVASVLISGSNIASLVSMYFRTIYMSMRVLRLCLKKRLSHRGGWAVICAEGICCFSKECERITKFQGDSRRTCSALWSSGPVLALSCPDVGLLLWLKVEVGRFVLIITHAISYWPG